MTGSTEDLVGYRINRAYETLKEAEKMIENEFWNASVNRIYYACFYAVIALLLKNGIDTGTHNGAKTKFSNDFIKTGIIELKYGKLYSKLFDYRQKGDYGDLFDFDEKIVLPLVDQVKEFISLIDKRMDDK